MVKKALENGGVYKWLAGSLLMLNVALVSWIVSGEFGVSAHAAQPAHQEQLEWDARAEQRLFQIEQNTQEIDQIREDQVEIKESLARIEAQLGIER